MRDEFFRRLMGTTLEQFMPRLMVLLGVAIVAIGTATSFLKSLGRVDGIPDMRF
jgi:hypothetical protein